jgi:hypothetical protein
MTTGLDLTRYRPPGVYVDAGATPTITTAGIDPTTVVLIGNGVGFHTFSETVSFASATTATLTKKGINPATIVVTGFITDPGAPSQSIPHTFVVNDDYDITTDTTDGADNSVTTIAKDSGGDIESAYPEVTVNYQYTDTTYHALNLFEDYSSFTDLYGPALDATTGEIISPLSLAAQVAILNGATRIYAIALGTTGTVQEKFGAAYSLLSASNTDANVVIPLWDGVTDGTVIQGMLQTLKAALLADATNAILRTAIVGFDSGYAPTPTNVANLALATVSERMIITWPNQLQFYNGTQASTTTVDGFYLAAACGGLLAAQAPQVPLTKKAPQGFVGLSAAVRQGLTVAVRNQLSEAGAPVVEVNRANALIVRHGVTTNFAGGVLTREISLVRARDALYNLLQDTLNNAGLVGEAIDPQTPMKVKGIVAGALETAKSSNLFNSYRDLAVRQQIAPTGDPTIIEVRFMYAPSYPLNYVLAQFSVDTTTGSVTATDVAA